MQLAQSYLQGQASPFDGVFEAYGQGLQNKRYKDQTQIVKAQQDREQQAYADLDSLDWDDINAVGQVMAKYPEHAKGAKDYYARMETKEQQALLSDMSKSISALGSDRPDIAVQSIRDKANAYRDMGNEEKADEYSEMADWMARDPQGAKRGLTMNYAVMAGKDAGSSYKSMVDANIAENESPYTINEKIANVGSTNATAQKTLADATNTVSEGLSTAAIGGNAGTFSLKAGMMHAQGLITDAQKQYIDEQLRNENPEAVDEFLNGLAGQNVEIAKLNKPEVSIVNAGGQLVAFKKNADGSVEVVGSVDKTLSPDTKYTQDSAGERVKLTTNASMYNAEQTRLLQEYKINLEDKNASKKLELAYAIEDNKKGVSKLENHGGKMYWVYPDQTAIPAKDINGKDIKPTVKTDSTVRTAIAEQQGMIDNGNELLRALRKAKVLSDQGIYFGKTAGARASIASSFKGGSEVSKRTQQYDALITNSALQSMKSIFGGNPTEGERALLLKIQASSEYPREVREKILNEAIAAAQNRIKSNQKQIQTLGGGQAGATKTSTNYGSVIEPIKK